jgi:hypothetical protein
MASLIHGRMYSKPRVIGLPCFVQQPLEPHVLSERNEFRLDADPLEGERRPRLGRALQERDRRVGVADQRVRGGGVVARERLVGSEAHAPIERFDRRDGRRRVGR